MARRGEKDWKKMNKKHLQSSSIPKQRLIFMCVIHINDLQFCFFLLTKQLIYLLHLIIAAAQVLWRTRKEFETVKVVLVKGKGKGKKAAPEAKRLMKSTELKSEYNSVSDHKLVSHGFYTAEATTVRSGNVKNQHALA